MRPDPMPTPTPMPTPGPTPGPGAGAGLAGIAAPAEQAVAMQPVTAGTSAARPPSAAWRVFLRERAPIPGFLAIGTAQAISARLLLDPLMEPESGIGLGPWLAAIGIAALLLLLRLMDEVKDFEKDLIAHPERPLPRGVLSVARVKRGLAWLGLTLLAYAAATGLLVGAAAGARTGVEAGALLACCAGFAFLMYHEFFAPAVLARSAFAYALSHQAIVPLMYVFAVAAAAPGHAFSAPALWFAATGLGASFVFEICRKLDPSAHPVLRTYLTVYGRKTTIALIVGALALLGFAARQIDVHYVVWPFIAVLVLLLPILYLRPGRYAIVAAAATLLAFVQMLAPTIRALGGWLP